MFTVNVVPVRVGGSNSDTRPAASADEEMELEPAVVPVRDARMVTVDASPTVKRLIVATIFVPEPVPRAQLPAVTVHAYV